MSSTTGQSTLSVELVYDATVVVPAGEPRDYNLAVDELAGRYLFAPAPRNAWKPIDRWMGEHRRYRTLHIDHGRCFQALRSWGGRRRRAIAGYEYMDKSNPRALYVQWVAWALSRNMTVRFARVEEAGDSTLLCVVVLIMECP